MKLLPTLSLLTLLFSSTTLALPSRISTRPDWHDKLTASESLKLSALSKSFGDFEAAMFAKYHPHFCSGRDIVDKKCEVKCSYRYGMDDTEGLLVGACMSVEDENEYLQKRKEVRVFEEEMGRKYGA